MVGQAPNRTKATSLIFSGSVSSLLLFLQEMDVDRMHDDVKTEAWRRLNCYDGLRITIISPAFLRRELG